LWLATTLSALGRGWLHFTKDRPYWSLFWSEELLSPPLSLFGVSWEQYVESPSAEGALTKLTAVLGVMFLLISARLAHATSGALSPDGAPRGTRGLKLTLWTLIALQLAYVSTYWFGHSMYTPIWLEQATQLILPWLCLKVGLYEEEPQPPQAPDTAQLSVSQESEHPEFRPHLLTLRTPPPGLSAPPQLDEDKAQRATSPAGLYLARLPIKLAALALSATFIGHALYAMGVYPVPGDFILMLMRTLGCDQQTALTLLWWAGTLDIVAALAVWTPRRYLRVRWAALAYMLVWGSLTALARVWGHWGMGSLSEVLWHWSPELILRLPHALISWWLLTLEGGVRPPWRDETFTLFQIKKERGS
jgi:hypothetical protein